MRSMKNKGFLIKKITLEEFIDSLIEVYDSGANYIDIISVPSEGQDTLSIIVRDEYFESLPMDELSEEDLNQLI